jgi:hypothetical protein
MAFALVASSVVLGTVATQEDFSEAMVTQALPQNATWCMWQVGNPRHGNDYYNMHLEAAKFTAPGFHFFIPSADLLDEPVSQSMSDKFCAREDVVCGSDLRLPGLDSVASVDKTLLLADTYHRVIEATGMVYKRATPCHRLANGDLGCHKMMDHPITFWNVTTEATTGFVENTLASVAVMCHKGSCHVMAPGDAVMFDSGGDNQEAAVPSKAAPCWFTQSFRVSAATGYEYLTSHITDAIFTHPGSHFFLPGAEHLDEPLGQEQSAMLCSHPKASCGPVPNVPGVDAFVTTNKTITLKESYHRVINATGLVYKHASPCHRLFNGDLGCHQMMDHPITLWNVTTMAISADFPEEVHSSVAVMCHQNTCHVTAPGDGIAFASKANVFII